MNSPESLKIIDELWDSPNDDVALSVRCVAAVVAAFMITPPSFILHVFVNPTVGFIGDNDAGKKFLNKRLSDNPNADGDVAPEFNLNSDTARLQNIMRFLTDIKDTLFFMNRHPWMSDSAESILRQELFEKRHTEEYVRGKGMFDQQGDRTSPAFVPAAQQDLITLTLEILACDSVANAATSQREVFSGICTQLTQRATAQPRRLAHVVLAEEQTNSRSRSEPPRAENSIEMVKLALGRVFQALPAPQNATPLAVHTSPP